MTKPTFVNPLSWVLLIIVGALIVYLGIYVLHSNAPKSQMEKASSPLQAWIETNSYTPFAVARAEWGPGTIVSFKNGIEQIEGFDKECLTLEEEKLLSDTAAAVVSGSYHITANDELEINLAKALKPGLEIRAAFKDHRVQGINVSLGSTEEEAASILTLKQRASELAAAHKDRCVNTLFAKNNAIICRVLRVGRLVYTFEGDAGASIGLDADLLRNIGIGAESAGTFQGQAGLAAMEPLLVGYRLCRLTAKAGFGVSDMVAEEMSPADIKGLKLASKASQ